MEHLIHFLNGKWSVLIAFVPVVNVVYLIYHFLTLHDKMYNISIWSLLTVAPLCILYRFVPENLDWIITHLIISTIVFLVIRRARGGHKIPVKIKVRWEIIFFCVVLSFGLIMSNVTTPNKKLAGSARDYAELLLVAIVNDDEAIWQKAIHPVYGPTFSSLDTVKKEIVATGITKDNYDISSAVIDDYEVSDGQAISAEFKLNITTGGLGSVECYRLKVIYQESENGKGITSIKFSKI